MTPRPTRKEPYGLNEGSFEKEGWNMCMSSWEEWIGSPEFRKELAQMLLNVNTPDILLEEMNDITQKHMYRYADAIIALLTEEEK